MGFLEGMGMMGMMGSMGGVTGDHFSSFRPWRREASAYSLKVGCGPVQKWVHGAIWGALSTCIDETEACDDGTEACNDWIEASAWAMR